MISEQRAVLSSNSDYCFCQDCNILALEVTQSEVASSIASSRKSDNRPPTFKSLLGHDYPYKSFERGGGGYRCRIRLKNVSHRVGQAKTTQYGLAQTARLTLICLLLAQYSTIEEDNSISWSVASGGAALMCLEQFVYDIRHDFEKLPDIPAASAAHKAKPDLNPEQGVDVVVNALKIVAADIQDVKTSKDLWKPQSKIVKEIVKVLSDFAEKVTAGNDLSDEEFPWIGASSKTYTFPTKEEFERDLEKLQKKLGNEKTKHTRLNIMRGLEPVAACFACEEVTNSSYNDYCVPGQIMHAQKYCKLRLMAAFSLECLLNGFLIDPFCKGEDFRKYIPPQYREDPFQMPVEVQKEVILKFLRAVEVITSWYVPFCLRDWDDEDDDNKFGVNARDDEVEKMKDVFQKRIGTKDNIERLTAELQNKDAMVRWCMHLFSLSTLMLDSPLALLI